MTTRQYQESPTHCFDQLSVLCLYYILYISIIIIHWEKPQVIPTHHSNCFRFDTKHTHTLESIWRPKYTQSFFFFYHFNFHPIFDVLYHSCGGGIPLEDNGYYYFLTWWVGKEREKTIMLREIVNKKMKIIYLFEYFHDVLQNQDTQFILKWWLHWLMVCVYIYIYSWRVRGKRKVNFCLARTWIPPSHTMRL